MNSHIRRAFWSATSGLLIAALVMGALNAPEDPALGTAQRTLYIHLPFALNAYLACLGAFIASVAYLTTRAVRWDSVAHAAARIAVLASTLVLITGMVLAKNAWGDWWVWSPKLTFSLVLWALFGALLLLRPLIRSAERRALASAVWVIIAFLDVPLVYLSVRLLPDVHPTSMEIDAAARATLLVACAAVTLLCAGLVVAPPGSGRARRRAAASPAAKPAL